MDKNKLNIELDFNDERYKKNSVIEIQKEIMDVYSFTEEMAKEVDTVLYQKLKENDEKNNTNYTIKYMNIMARNIQKGKEESAEDYEERVKNTRRRALYKEGISVSYINEPVKEEQDVKKVRQRRNNKKDKKLEETAKEAGFDSVEEYLEAVEVTRSSTFDFLDIKVDVSNPKYENFKILNGSAQYKKNKQKVENKTIQDKSEPKIIDEPENEEDTSKRKYIGINIRDIIEKGKRAAEIRIKEIENKAVVNKPQVEGDLQSENPVEPIINNPTVAKPEPIEPQVIDNKPTAVKIEPVDIRVDQDLMNRIKNARKNEPTVAKPEPIEPQVIDNEPTVAKPEPIEPQVIDNKPTAVKIEPVDIRVDQDLMNRIKNARKNEPTVAKPEPIEPQVIDNKTTVVKIEPVKPQVLKDNNTPEPSKYVNSTQTRENDRGDNNKNRGRKYKKKMKKMQSDKDNDNKKLKMSKKEKERIKRLQKEKQKAKNKVFYAIGPEENNTTIYKKVTRLTGQILSKMTNISSGIKQTKKGLVIVGALGCCMIAIGVAAIHNTNNKNEYESANRGYEGEIIEALDGSDLIIKDFEDIGNVEKEEDKNKESEEKTNTLNGVKDRENTDKEDITKTEEGIKYEEENRVKEINESTEENKSYLEGINVGDKVRIDQGTYFANPEGEGNPSKFENHQGTEKTISKIYIAIKDGYISVTENEIRLTTKGKVIILENVGIDVAELKSRYPDGKFSYHIKEKRESDFGDLGWVTEKSFEQMLEQNNAEISNDIEER